LIIAFTLSIIVFGTSGEKLLDDISERYASAEGIQWQIRSIVYSEIFDEAETTFVELAYAPPDTFSMTSDLEKIVGIGDTLWVMSIRHRQVQKKSMAGAQLPINYILNWKHNYDLGGYSNDESEIVFDLEGMEGVIPETLAITADRKMNIKEISYTDSKGDDVVLTIRRQKLKRPGEIDLFFLNIPDGFDFIDVTE
jgi:outer membrane lipoprotein-sorting protein